MTEFNCQYFFICRLDDDKLPYLTPDTSTEGRTFRFEQQPTSSPPLVFFNGTKDFDKQRGIKSTKIPPPILFEGSNMIVASSIINSLLEKNIPNLFFHPSVYIHDDGKWYEDYWYMTFSEEFDCWDRNLSDYEKVPLEIGGYKLYSVYTYALNCDLLEKTPLNQRTLFKLGGSQDAFIVCHESILQKVFGQAGKNGAAYIRIDEY